MLGIGLFQSAILGSLLNYILSWGIWTEDETDYFITEDGQDYFVTEDN